MKFLLDTNTCIYALKQNQSVLGQLLSQNREDILLSVISEGELRTGAAKSSSRSLPAIMDACIVIAAKEMRRG